MTTIRKLWSGVVTDKVAESRDFYVRYFNSEVIYEGEDLWVVVLSVGESELGFMKPRLAFQSPLFQSPFTGQGLWFTVDVDDADAEYERIRALGAPIEVPLRDEPWGERHFSILDPNGIGVDIVQRLQ